MYLCRVPEREAVVHAGEQEGGGEEGPHHLEQRAEGNGGAQGIKPLQFNPNQARQYFFLK